ncbi:hypothetical protein C2G38_2097619 [Gigaspora rosea]|uniref:Uncharacterized protein n=1 Tax=Gigaspora rosea TaxID=44941 RepID=A0A397UVV6_9GLOM|nr:hypothetical protein C2G38_2097619 [Gigaspora rosea]
MTKIRAYYMANIQSELTYFDAELTEFELCKMVKIDIINMWDSVFQNREVTQFKIFHQCCRYYM